MNTCATDFMLVAMMTEVLGEEKNQYSTVRRHDALTTVFIMAM